MFTKMAFYVEKSIQFVIKQGPSYDNIPLNKPDMFKYGNHDYKWQLRLRFFFCRQSSFTSVRR
jgi:hypothetical protein